MHFFLIKNFWRCNSKSIFRSSKDFVHFIDCSWKDPHTQNPQYGFRMEYISIPFMKARSLDDIRNINILQVIIFQIVEYMISTDMYLIYTEVIDTVSKLFISAQDFYYTDRHYFV